MKFLSTKFLWTLRVAVNPLFKLGAKSGKSCGAMVLAFLLSVSVAQADGHLDFVGNWDGFDTKGNSYTISLAEDGTAAGTLESGMTGLWQMRGDVAYVEWNNGWKAMIVSNDEGFTKLAFSPSKSFTSVPDGISNITKQ